MRFIPTLSEDLLFYREIFERRNDERTLSRLHQKLQELTIGVKYKVY